jgi:predicted  nucleic acid-binding Zn-ribbon protein
MKTEEMFKKITEKLEEISAENSKLLSRIDAIEHKLEEMAKGQLLAIAEQGERFMEAIKASKTPAEAKINIDALSETLSSVDQETLAEIIETATGGNSEVAQKLDAVMEELKEMNEGLNVINDNIINANKNIVVVGDNLENGMEVSIDNGITHFNRLKDLILQMDKTVTGIDYSVKSIPTGRGLY